MSEHVRSDGLLHLWASFLDQYDIQHRKASK